MEQQQLKAFMSTLREKRNAAGHTQNQAAELIGVSVSYYSKLERSSQEPSLDILLKICDIYHISVDRVLLKWPPKNSVSPEEMELLNDIQSLDPTRLQDYRNIIDRQLALIREKSNRSETPPQAAGHQT